MNMPLTGLVKHISRPNVAFDALPLFFPFLA
jgi:hypothetical protein